MQLLPEVHATIVKCHREALTLGVGARAAPQLGREVLEALVDQRLGSSSAEGACAELNRACKGLLVACERWSLISECSQVLELMKKAAIERPVGLQGRLIEAGMHYTA